MMIETTREEKRERRKRERINLPSLTLCQRKAFEGDTGTVVDDVSIRSGHGDLCVTCSMKKSNLEVGGAGGWSKGWG